MQNETELKKAIEIALDVFSKENFCFYILTGAGASKASGIATFRGKGGLWENEEFIEVATPKAWISYPEKGWTLYKQEGHIVIDAKPNPTHEAIAILEKMDLVSVVITQNVDSLHQKAGSKKVIELHGNLSRVKCIKCGKSSLLEKMPVEIPPKCSCGGLLRPDVVLFGETLPQKETEKAFSIAKKADLVLIVGTSAEVVPVAHLPYLSKKNNAKIIVFNAEITDHKDISDAYIQGKCEKWLPKFVEELEKIIKK